MSRLTQCLESNRSQQRPSLITYIIAGDPEPEATVDTMHQLAASGADVIELGVPFSDPMADGPVIQRGFERALTHGVHLEQVLDQVAQFRQRNQHTPVVLMSYRNPMEAMGFKQFVTAAHQAGIDGLITVDWPPQANTEDYQWLRQHNIAPIFLIAPTTSKERQRWICQQAQGFIYFVSLKGTTGSSHLDVQSVANHMRQLRDLTQLPLAVGFGINNAASAVQVAQHADAVVIGSRIVELLHQTPSAERLSQLGQWLAEVRRGLDESIYDR